MTEPTDCPAPSCDQQKLILQYAAETRRFEIERFWQRSLFFWGFIGTAFVAYAASISAPEGRDLQLPIACFGGLSSLAWTLMNRGSKYWQVAWENKVHAVEGDVLGIKLFASIEPLSRDGVWGPARYSVSKLTVALSDLTTLFWLGLAIHLLPLNMAPLAVPAPYLIFGAALVYAIAILLGGRSRNSD